MKPRYASEEPGALRQALASLDKAFHAFPNQADPRLHTTYWDRGTTRWRLGYPVDQVIADLRNAAVCIDGEASIRLFKLEHHRLRTRRIDPLHLAALHPNPDMLERFGREYGLPLAVFYAGAATSTLESELGVISGYFSRRAKVQSGESERRLRSPSEMVGLAAATYAATFGYIAAGDAGSAAIALTMVSSASETLESPPPEPARKYLRQCAALAAIHSRDADDLSQALPPLVSRTSKETGVIDLVVPAIVGLAMLANVDPDLAALRQACPMTWSLANAVQEAWYQVE